MGPFTDKIPLGFQEKVRVLDTPATRAAGLAGRRGEVWGMISPSATEIPTVGEIDSDCGAFVMFADPEEGFCFPLDLLEFLDFTPGNTLIARGVPKRWTLREDGKWHEAGRILPPNEWAEWLRRRTSNRGWLGRLLGGNAVRKHAA
jgi:hypothetical protein